MDRLQLMPATDEDILLEKKVLRTIARDVAKTAEAVELKYVSCNEPGFIRVRGSNGSFQYLDGSKKLTDPDQLERIRKLVIPPAWENVWICKDPYGHLQATGIDKIGRKQYRYHPRWMKVRNDTKYYRLREFGERLPLIRIRLEKDLAIPGYPQNKVLAAMVSLIENSSIRIGNAFYEKLYGSFGLTTLKDNHVRIEGTKLRLMFTGKKGVSHNINLASKKLSKIIQGCKDIPGKELFQYYDEEGVRKSVDSGMVNSYIREISESDFTAKDFRTWTGSIQALLAFREIGGFTSQTDMNKKIASAYDMVAQRLGNTRAVVKKYYVHPVIIKLYQEEKLDKYLKELNGEAGKDENGYEKEERILLKILRSPLS